MYEYIFYCMRLWKNGDEKSANITAGKHTIPSMAPACKYSIIANSYMLLDAVIHTYIALNGYEANDNEVKNSVYSKWKNFPYVVQGKFLNKNDIIIIDEIRKLRNDIVHPKFRTKTLSKKVPKGQSIEFLDPDTGDLKGYFDWGVEQEFKPVHGVFLVNEVTRLVTLAKKELREGEKFLPKRLLRITSNSDENIGQKWPKDVSLT